jgi:hypothetical protein
MKWSKHIDKKNLWTAKLHLFSFWTKLYPKLKCLQHLSVQGFNYLVCQRLGVLESCIYQQPSSNHLLYLLPQFLKPFFDSPVVSPEIRALTPGIETRYFTKKNREYLPWLQNNIAVLWAWGHRPPCQKAPILSQITRYLYMDFLLCSKN